MNSFCFCVECNQLWMQLAVYLTSALYEFIKLSHRWTDISFWKVTIQFCTVCTSTWRKNKSIFITGEKFMKLTCRAIFTHILLAKSEQIFVSVNVIRYKNNYLSRQGKIQQGRIINRRNLYFWTQNKSY